MADPKDMVTREEKDELLSLCKEMLYEIEISPEEAACIFPADLLGRLKEVAVKGRLPE